MTKKQLHLTPVLCFLFMPILILLLIGAMKLGIVTPDTQVPDGLAVLLNWRLSSTTFSHAVIGGVLVCLVLTLYVGKYQDEHGHSSKARKVFDWSVIFIARNLYFWSGNFLAYSIGSYYLDFIEPVSLQIPMVFLLLLTGFAIKFLGKLVGSEVFQTSQ